MEWEPARPMGGAASCLPPAAGRLPVASWPPDPRFLTALTAFGPAAAPARSRLVFGARTPESVGRSNPPSSASTQWPAGREVLCPHQQHAKCPGYPPSSLSLRFFPPVLLLLLPLSSCSSQPSHTSTVHALPLPLCTSGDRIPSCILTTAPAAALAAPDHGPDFACCGSARSSGLALRADARLSADRPASPRPLDRENTRLGAAIRLRIGSLGRPHTFATLAVPWRLRLQRLPPSRPRGLVWRTSRTATFPAL